MQMRLELVCASRYPQKPDQQTDEGGSSDSHHRKVIGTSKENHPNSFSVGGWFSCWRLVSMLAVVCDAAGGFFPASGLTSSWKLLVSCWRLVSLQAVVFVACGWLSCWRLAFLLAASCPAGGWFPCWLLAAGFPGGSWFSCQR